MSEKKIPITRMNKFFSGADFDLNLQMGEEYLKGDLGFKLVLFRVDRTAGTDDIYGESDVNEIKYHPPVEFYGLIEVEEPVNKAIKSGSMGFLEAGNLKISVYKHHLAELGVDIMRGDYIGYVESEDRVRYYMVANDGRVTSDNAHTYGGLKSFYRSILCTPVQSGEFRGNL